MSAEKNELNEAKTPIPMMDNLEPLKISVLYDNLSLRDDRIADWGFSCLIQGRSKTILFDTGASGKILLGNMARAGFTPQQIDAVLISHDHKDHSGGLASLLEKYQDIEVWLPSFFPQAFKDSISSKGAKLTEVKEFQNICGGVYTTGIIPGWIKEQSLILDTPKGLVLITGCAHPRIVNIINFVSSRFDSQIYLVMGGFHLAGFEKMEIQAIIRNFKQAGVLKVGPAHCSGELSHALFSGAYGSNCLKIGVGREIIIS